MNILTGGAIIGVSKADWKAIQKLTRVAVDTIKDGMYFLAELEVGSKEYEDQKRSLISLVSIYVDTLRSGYGDAGVVALHNHLYDELQPHKVSNELLDVIPVSHLVTSMYIDVYQWHSKELYKRTKPLEPVVDDGSYW